MYFVGLLMEMILKKYSNVKNTVITHSAKINSSAYFEPNDGTLSSSTSITLIIITTNSKISKNLPSGVSASYIISWIFLLHALLAFTEDLGISNFSGTYLVETRALCYTLYQKYHLH